ncbi:MAG TPA: thioredoxin domain-containing protein [Candidatus Nitrosotenuis sp.]|nr:thioredoxin domain-containing protein [Candidatus Nitrosotenuis sp.]
MTPIRWIIFAAIVVLSLGGLIALSSKDKIKVDSVDTNAILRDGDNADHVYGNPNAKVVLIEYGDFQCPGCAGAHSKLAAIKEAYKGEMAFVFRHFPLTTIHANALAASSAAEAAGMQGKFWEMHDLLYQSQDSWENLRAEDRGAIFESYAAQLGLNIDQFNTDIASEKVSKKIAYDRAIGAKAKVDSTPTLFLNGEKVSDELVTDVVQQNGDKLKAKIEALIKQTGGTVPEAKPELETNPVEPTN